MVFLSSFLICSFYFRIFIFAMTDVCLQLVNVHAVKPFSDLIGAHFVMGHRDAASRRSRPGQGFRFRTAFR